MGRPTILADGEKMLQVGVDIGGSHITACLFDGERQELLLESMTTRHPDPNGTANELIGVWAEAIELAIKQSNAPVRGVGIAVPGPFDYAEGISLVIGVNKFECIYGVNIKEELSQRLKLEKSQIRFVNDASAFGIAVTKVGLGKGANRCVALTLGTGLGSSFLVDGVPVLSGDEVPENGWLYNGEFQGEMADDHFSARGLVGLYKSLGGKEASTALDVFTLAKSDPLAQKTFELFGSRLGSFLDPYIQRFGAQILVLGGNLSRSFALFELDLLKELSIDSVVVSPMLDHAPLIGGAMLFEEEYYGNLAQVINRMK
ncbi:ROK family protein [Echinicola strongylocentroti]|uniref:ROK family protein n=1 Tax=Echinicola strongylocentroti TaxID=1795355 RepID=A0A2Z4IRM4_9BACT|nr:ROK family protein [Echinicola strongylocentroti]AWW32953.1 ROK family protein [Echinicola strongylocentroti]